MYEVYFNLKEKPFTITPDPGYFYSSYKHQQALDSLLYAINDRRGFVVITGEIGSGKTTVCRTLLNRLDCNVKTAIINNTHLTNKQLIANILDEFEVCYDDGDKYQLLRQLNDFFIEQHAADNIIVLIIDEAQNLSRSVLEELRMLSNFETDKAKLVQIVLMGQPELKDKLYHKSLTQLRQRVAIHYHLDGLTIEETYQYVKHRVAVASHDPEINKNLFSSEALDALYKYSNGIPRLVNIICDNALLTAYAHDHHQISFETIIEAVEDNNIIKNQVI